MPMHDVDLPAGYSIAESGVPGVPPKHQVQRGSGRDQQLLGVRDNREEATQLAIRDNDRIQAERAAARNRRPGPDLPCPARAHGIHLVEGENHA